MLRNYIILLIHINYILYISYNGGGWSRIFYGACAAVMEASGGIGGIYPVRRQNAPCEFLTGFPGMGVFSCNHEDFL